jgi:hypothetical protein
MAAATPAGPASHLPRGICALRRPGRIGHIGETLLAPTLMALARPSRNSVSAGILAGTDYWAQGYSEPGAGPTWPASVPGPAAMRTRVNG